MHQLHQRHQLIPMTHPPMQNSMKKRQNLSTSWAGASELPVNSWTSPYIFFAENVSFVLCDVESYMLYLWLARCLFWSFIYLSHYYVSHKIAIVELFTHRLNMVYTGCPKKPATLILLQSPITRRSKINIFERCQRGSFVFMKRSKILFFGRVKRHWNSIRVALFFWNTRVPTCTICKYSIMDLFGKIWFSYHHKLIYIMKSTQFKWEEVSNSHGIFEKAPTYSKKVYSIKDILKMHNPTHLGLYNYG